jgi:cytochrome c556
VTRMLIRAARAVFHTGVLSFVLAGSAVATADEGAESIIRHRIASFREIGTAYKAIGDELKRARPEVSRLRESAELIRVRSTEVLEWFPAGSEPPRPEGGWLDAILAWFSSDDEPMPAIEVRSRARQSIWTERAKFEQAAKQFSAEASALAAAARSGERSVLSARLRSVGASCSRCHDDFREKMD